MMSAAQHDERSQSSGSPMIFTLGHSTRRLDAFIRLIQAHDLDMILDVRKIPGSRQNPQFNIDTLPAALEQAAIGYQHLPALGGLRRANVANPTNAGWRNLSFRAYADYMQTDAFKAGLDECVRLAKGRRAALMCAEAVPWRCHRSLIADALLVRGFAVFEITSAVTARPHHLTPFAKVCGSEITYPAFATSLVPTELSRSS
jgi:uncharacterized protein (DUF488 family)